MRFNDSQDSTPEREQRLVRVLPRRLAVYRAPLAGEVCISITNPRQSPAALEEGYADVLRLGFHDTDQVGGNFTVMSRADADAVLEFAGKHQHAPLMVHCEAGASRSVGVGLFLAAWLNRPLLLVATDVLEPNPWVVNQLRGVALYRALRTRDWRLLGCALFGRKEKLAARIPD